MVLRVLTAWIVVRTIGVRMLNDICQALME